VPPSQERRQPDLSIPHRRAATPLGSAECRHGDARGSLAGGETGVLVLQLRGAFALLVVAQEAPDRGDEQVLVPDGAGQSTVVGVAAELAFGKA
jgi:hypothetical protein